MLRDDRRRLDPGTRLHDTYVIERVLGAGGFAITYLAWDENFRRRVAIKEYFPTDPGLMQSSFWRGQFLEEARSLMQLDHPNIVRVLNYFDEEATGTAYIVMQYVEGISLREYLTKYGDRKRQGILPMALIRPIAEDLSDALKHVHAKGLVHSDISLNNIIMTDEGPVLIDFGAARQAVRSTTLISGPRVATDGFASPEQYVSDTPMKFRNDIYALGAVLYACITGAPPVSSPQRLAGVLHKPAALVARRHYKREFVAAIDRALDLDPNRRPGSVEQFRRELFHRPQWPRIAASMMLLAALAGGAMYLIATANQVIVNSNQTVFENSGLHKRIAKLEDKVKQFKEDNLKHKTDLGEKQRENAALQKAKDALTKDKAEAARIAQQQFDQLKAENSRLTARNLELQEKVEQSRQRPKLADKSLPLPGEARRHLGGPPVEQRPTVFVVNTGDTLNLRDRAGTDSNTIVVLAPGTRLIRLVGEETISGSIWFRVKAGAVEGWVNSKFITPMTDS